MSFKSGPLSTTERTHVNDFVSSQEFSISISSFSLAPIWVWYVIHKLLNYRPNCSSISKPHHACSSGITHQNRWLCKEKVKTSQHIPVIGPPCKKKSLHHWTQLLGKGSHFTCTKCFKSYHINISAFIWFTAWFVELMDMMCTSVFPATGLGPLKKHLMRIGEYHTVCCYSSSKILTNLVKFYWPLITGKSGIREEWLKF